MLTTQLACGKARKCMAACPQAFANPASLLHGHPVSAVGRQVPHHYLSSLHTSGPGVCLPGETRGKGAQANAAGMRTWEDSLDSCTPLPFLPQGILARRDTWRWRPLVRLIKKPFKLDEPVIYSLNAGLPGSGWQMPLCHLDERVSSASCTLILGSHEKWEAVYTLKPLPCDPAQESKSTDWSCFPRLPSPSCFCFV